ncbi:heme oxygenase [Williamsia limnetica]|uniref:Heme oxygenase n=1 Tax=Williamsia limnetica TaxID=882452 RepID=A0A318RF57_WILLI|nr:biliverdin-producing heme oxygenase [Williamsia limnetica]PYE15388.1 heme oxygenase [Williamsia limnetica]
MTTFDPATPTAIGSVSARLRAATAVAHERAEGSAFVEQLLGGRLDVAAYYAMAAQLYFVYDELEIVGDGLHHDRVGGAVHDERLRRAPRLLADLTELGIGAEDMVPLPATLAYVAQIRATAGDPVAFVAHHYTRYLGDLSGGQVIRSRMKLHYGLADGALSFYVFDGIDKLKLFKDDYRATLDGLELTEPDIIRLLDEAVRAFESNEALFAELGERLP